MMKKILLISLLFLTKTLFAQIPANDECASAATLITSSNWTSTSGNLQNATTSTVTPSCSGYNDLFYKFVATSASASVIVTPTSLLHAKVSVFAACGAASIACGDNAPQGVVEIITLPTLTVGSTYYIKVSSTVSTLPPTPTFTICVVNPPPISTPPANEECASAITLTPSAICTTTPGNLTNATTSTVTTSCGGYNDVFYKFVATSTSALITVTPGNSLDATVSVFDACGATSIACENNTYGGTAESVPLTTLTVGSTYYIKVSSYFASPPLATFTICVVNTPPANNECASATPLTPSATCITTSGTLLNATTSTVTTSCGGYNDVFYKFVAISPSASITVTPSSTLDSRIGVYTACGGTSIACVDNSGGSAAETASLTTLTVGSTYYIKVSSVVSTLPSTPTFTICVLSTPPTPPANDECASATTLTPSATCITTSGTLLNAITSTVTTFCGGYNDVFYKFVAISASASITVTPSSTLDSRIGVYTACGGTSIACIDNSGGSAAETASLTTLTVGTTYYIKVSSVVSTLPSTPTFTICVVSTSPTPPANDECANAILLTPSASCVNTTGTFDNAINSGVTNSCTGYSDVFYKFVANSSTATITAAPGTGVDVVLSVMPSCSSSTSLACVNNLSTSSATEVANLTGLTIGNTYFIKVQNFTTTPPSTSAFTICVISNPTTIGTPPANDECANATAITSSATCIPSSGTLLNATTSTITPSCSSYYDVFYKFVAASTTSTVKVVGSSGLDVKISAFAACGGANINCIDSDNNLGGSETMTLSSLIVDNTYYIKVANFTTTISSTYTFTICVQNGITTASQSSTALNAISLYPNPTQNVLNIENVSIDTKVEFIDLTGKTIFVRDLSSETQIDLSNYSAGVYILKLTSDGVSENRRIVLSK